MVYVLPLESPQLCIGCECCRYVKSCAAITETADKLRWLRYQKGLRQRDVADYAGIDRSTYVHYEEYGKDLYPPEHMEKIAQLFEVPVETLLDMNLVGPNSARNI